MAKDNHDSRPSDDAAIKKIVRNHWTRDEDEVLKEYVKTYGEGNWHKVQKHMGLGRIGKSCRLRWVNHLSPNLKKGVFTKEEEQLVINFHAFWENSWARIAKELPGRTNDDVKNFWNTRVKRLQRRGLPNYQMEGTEKAMNARAQYDSLDGYYGQDSLMANQNVPINQGTSSYDQNQAMNEAAEYGLNTNAYQSQDSLVANQNVSINQWSSSYNQNQGMNATTQYGLNTESLDVAYHSQDFLVTNNYVPINQSSSYYQSVPCNLPATGQCFSQPNMNNFPESETTFPFTGGYAMNEQSPPPLWNYSFVENTPQQLPDSYLLGNDTYASPFKTLNPEAENFDHLSSFQSLNSHEEPISYGVAQSTPMSSLDTNKTWIISDFPPPLGDDSMEISFYGSNTDLESPLLQSNSLGYAELTPTTTNTTGQSFNFESDLGYYGSTSSNESTIHSYSDWIQEFLSEDGDNTK